MKDCKDVALFIERNDWNELSFKEKLDLKFHIAMCGNCRGYKKFSHVLKSLFGDIAKTNECLSYEEKEEMKRKINS